MRLHLIAIPRTGSTSLAAALAPYRWIQRNGHPFRLSMLGPDDLALTIVRDPVARFLSAFAWHARTHPDPPGSPDALALAGIPDDEEVYRPQSWWLDGDLARCLWVGRTETLGQDARHLALALGVDVVLGHENAAPTPHPVLSPEAEAAVREHYAEDYRLIESL